ncbi:MAG TPA: nodulation protein NfeD [Candidatus Kapabacteria bacterium]|nr:nodulation protein NfeD [Candidatus Kapabacteria bacterium]
MAVYKYIIFSLVFVSSYSFSNDIYVLTINEAITPAASFYISNGIKDAETAKATLVILQLNTPGGLLDATRDIVNHIFESTIPICVYVAPSGSRAGSAGVFITLAANIAAMSPGTNIGAAHPVGLDGSSDSTVMGQKIENDASAFIRSIAQKRHRNYEWAERAVRNSESITENEALSLNVVDIISPNIHSLLHNLDGRALITKAGTSINLNTSNYRLVYRDKNVKEELLTLLSNPNLLYIMILIGIWGIIYEFKSPGAIYPGAIGTSLLLIAAYSLQLLSINYLGLSLIFLAIILFILEIFIQSYALLTIGGIVSFTFGSLLLIDSPEEFMRVSLSLIIVSTLLTALLFGTIVWLGIKAQNKKKAQNVSEMSGMQGYSLSAFTTGNNGKVHLNGEIWQAISLDDIEKGDKVEVEKIEGFKLIVKKII